MQSGQWHSHHPKWRSKENERKKWCCEKKPSRHSFIKFGFVNKETSQQDAWIIHFANRFVAKGKSNWCPCGRLSSFNLLLVWKIRDFVHFFSYALISIPSAVEGWISESQFQWAPAQLVGWFSNFQYQISVIEVFYYTFFSFNKHNFDLHLFNLITCSQGEIPLCTYDATQIYLSIMICNKKSGIFRILWLQRWRICFFHRLEIWLPLVMLICFLSPQQRTYANSVHRLNQH